MIQRILSSKNFVACLLAAATGMALYFKLRFPAENVFLQLMALRAPLVHEGLFYSYSLLLFTTPYIAYSIVLSGLHVFGLTLHKKIRAGKLPLYPDPREREELFVVVGEVHNKRKPGSSETLHWLTIPERGLFTGIVIVGAIGTGEALWHWVNITASKSNSTHTDHRVDLKTFMELRKALAVTFDLPHHLESMGRHFENVIGLRPKAGVC
jgi:hypothetical protein